MRAKRNPITIGEEFTRLTVIAYAGKNKHGQSMYECLCICGKISIAMGGSLRNGSPKSCGCLTVDSARAQATHGMAGVQGKRAPEYSIYAAMKQRCYNPKCLEYKNYGARGIQVYPEWRESFEAFIRDVGRRPSPRHSLDRIDNNANYEPGNVRWVTIDVQQRNKRNNVMLTYDDETRCSADWADHLGIHRHTLDGRLKDGWSVERALTTPVKQRSKPSPITRGLD